jgi:hypothetical protein
MFLNFHFIQSCTPFIFFRNCPCHHLETINNCLTLLKVLPLVVWQGLAKDSLKIHLGPPCPTLLCPVGGLPLKQPYGFFRRGSLTGRASCDRFLPTCTPTTVRLCSYPGQPHPLDPAGSRLHQTLQLGRGWPLEGQL